MLGSGFVNNVVSKEACKPKYWKILLLSRDKFRFRSMTNGFHTHGKSSRRKTKRKKIFLFRFYVTKHDKRFNRPDRKKKILFFISWVKKDSDEKENKKKKPKTEPFTR